jgi:ketosteroid isomerase-like protein
VTESELVLRSAYRAFNARDVEAALELMHPEVDWPNAWEGGRVVGHAAIRDYWNRQFAAISSSVEPLRFIEETDGSITVDVHQVVRDAHTGELLSESSVRHCYQLKDGLVVRMDVLEQTPSRLQEATSDQSGMSFSRNIELKARNPDPASSLQTSLALRAEDQGFLYQIDTYFNVAKGRLKLRGVASHEPGDLMLRA